jgi:hypothetical protein
MIQLLQCDQQMHTLRHNYNNVLTRKLLHNELRSFVGHIVTIFVPTDEIT